MVKYIFTISQICKQILLPGIFLLQFEFTLHPAKNKPSLYDLQQMTVTDLTSWINAAGLEIHYKQKHQMANFYKGGKPAI